MAGFLDVPQIKDEVNKNLQWMYDNGIYYEKVKLDSVYFTKFMVKIVIFAKLTHKLSIVGHCLAF